VEVAAAQTIDIGRSLRILWANAWIVILTIVVAAGGVYVWSSRRPEVYEGTALVRALNLTNPGTTPGGGRVDSVREVDIQVLYAQSPEVVSEFELRMGNAVPQVRSTSVSAVRTADALAIAVESETKQVAQEGAATYAQAYIDRQRAALARRLDTLAGSLRAQANDVQAQIGQLDAQIAALQPTAGSQVVLLEGRPAVLPETEQLRNLSSQRNALADKSADLLIEIGRAEADSRNRQADIDFVQRPALPQEPVSPMPRRDAAIAALAGLFVGLGLVVLKNRLRERINTSADLKGAVPDVLFVTAIPPNGSGFRRRRGPTLDLMSSGDGQLAESYRSLRAGLRVANPPESSLVLLVTSARAAEGKTTVTANLGISLAQAGERVLVVDCDLRHPNLHSLFSISNELGFSSVAKNVATLDDAIQEVSIPGGSLGVLPAGQLTTSPAELLSARGAGSLFADLKSRYDYVLVDSSPVLPVADALTLSRFVDQVLIIVGAGRTPTAAFHDAGQLLAQFDAPLQAAVLVGARHERGNGYSEYPARAETNGAGKRSHGNRRRPLHRR